MAVRSRKETKKYTQYLKTTKSRSGCVFCGIGAGDEQFVRETKSFKIIRNIFSYSYWDAQDVVDHLLLVPKKHTNTLNDLNASEAVEYVDIIGSYDAQGYNIWARSKDSIIKTVVHQHTHLIKPGTKRQKFVFFTRKPYFRITR